MKIPFITVCTGGGGMESTMREFKTASSLSDGNLALSIAPALTPKGVEENPLFFTGELVHPVVISRGLLVLADIAGTRYFQYTPVAQRDPVLSAQGDRLRAECFSACNGVYARLDVFREALYGDIFYGTTNVDIGAGLRKSLIQVRQGDRLKLNIGGDGLQILHRGKCSEAVDMLKMLVQRPVEMPDRWIRALGNCAMLHQSMQYRFHIDGVQAKSFIALLPPTTGKEQSGWLTPTKSGVILKPVREKNSVYISGLHRLSALKRVMSDVNTVCFYAPENEEKGQIMIVVGMSGANLTLSLTAKSRRGYSGEGALLESLSDPDTVRHVKQIAGMLSFNANINLDSLSKSLGFTKKDAQTAVGLLAVSGKLGFDARDRAFFHRELPDEPERVHGDNPRLLAARKLMNDTVHISDNIWHVKSGRTTYRITYDPNLGTENAKCTCAWYLNCQNGRGPCKHILAVKLKVLR